MKNVFTTQAQVRSALKYTLSQDRRGQYYTKGGMVVEWDRRLNPKAVK